LSATSTIYRRRCGSNLSAAAWVHKRGYNLLYDLPLRQLELFVVAPFSESAKHVPSKIIQNNSQYHGQRCIGRQPDA
jgi:hypothetical protein